MIEMKKKKFCPKYTITFAYWELFMKRGTYLIKYGELKLPHASWFGTVINDEFDFLKI